MEAAQNGEILPLLGKLFHHFILTKSQVSPNYNICLPVKINSVLPGIVIPTAIYCGEKVWKMNYYGNRRSKALDSKQWKKFVNDNGLKCGDGCVFELLECTTTLLKFRVQILRGHIPFQLHHKFAGETKDTPIIID